MTHELKVCWQVGANLSVLSIGFSWVMYLFFPSLNFVSLSTFLLGLCLDIVDMFVSLSFDKIL